MTTQIAAHRGGAILWIENSRDAFRRAAALAVEQIEFDVHLSADDVVMVLHDATLERTTEGQGPLRAQTAAALTTTRLKGTDGETIPTLEEVLDLFAATKLIPRIELKRDAEGCAYPGLLPRVVAALQARGLTDRTVITSFDLAQAAAAAPLFIRPSIWLVSLSCWKDLGVAGVAGAARNAGITAVGLHQSVCDADSLEALRCENLGVGAWAVNGPATIRRILALGVDVFTTDDPVTALEARRALQETA
ncbi:glycerophosphodiester phosphodiesterase family protein [Roseomonas sp. 18066]|uniref:glycerophosphodiester phosphodiesterase family protein n=1 Tax=Roseomonas sp. 18066 TaxID=2681412 RepID=UPI001357C417|nr:glycerophosphodiester phosphodiesterase family protein [Roseomonas sp. 18066]